MSVEVGQVIKGKVTGIQTFGAFVALDEKNTQGLVHISEVSNTYVKDINEFLKVGQEVEVKVIKIDDEKKKISLSIRALMPNPEGNKPTKQDREAKGDREGQPRRRPNAKGGRRQASAPVNYKSDPELDNGYNQMAEAFKKLDL